MNGEAAAPASNPLDAVLFDLDGTLVSSELDFDAIRKEAGIQSGPILEYLAAASPEERARVENILDRHEEHAARRCTLAEGVREVFRLLEERGVKKGILTRNSRRTVHTVIARHGLRVDTVVAREDAAPKPSPEPVYAACRMLGTRPERVLVVGDYQFDIECGRRAGARTAYLRVRDRVKRVGLPVESDFDLGSLQELIPILQAFAPRLRGSCAGRGGEGGGTKASGLRQQARGKRREAE